jgi:hypothetical protein
VLKFGFHGTFIAALKRIPVKSIANTLSRQKKSARGQVIWQIRSTMISPQGKWLIR